MKNIQFTVLMCTYSKDDPYLLEKAIKRYNLNNNKNNPWEI